MDKKAVMIAFANWGAKKYKTKSPEEFLQAFQNQPDEAKQQILQEFQNDPEAQQYLQEAQSIKARLGAKLHYIQRIKYPAEQFKDGGEFCHTCLG